MDNEHLQTSLRLARSIAVVLRGNGEALDELLGAAELCRDARLPDDFTGVGLVVWRQRRGAGAPPLRADLQYIVDRQATVERENAEALEAIARLACGTEEPALIGDGAVLLGLYGTLAAFRAAEWVVLVRQGANGAAAAAAGGDLPFVLRVGPSQRLEVPLARWSAGVEAAGCRWRVPVDELFVVLLAARVGDPAALPSPPHWFHLAVAMLAWRDRLNVHTVLTLADRLDLAAKAQRGLAMVGSLFPELKPGLDLSSFEIPLWERLLAVPVAARRVVRESMAEVVRGEGE